MNNRAWKSVSGHALEGSSLTRFAYLDETGLANPVHEPFLVVAGVLVNADQHITALERLADRVIPDKFRDGFYFHAKDLFPGAGKVFGKNGPLHDYDKRMDIARHIAAIPKKLKLVIPFGITERSSWPRTDLKTLTPRQQKLGPHITSYINCVMDVEMWMRDHASNEVALIVVEDNDEVKHTLKEAQNTVRKVPKEMLPSERERKYFPFRKVKTSPLFETKDDSVALQMADFVAYVIKRRAMGDTRTEPFFQMLRPLFARDEVQKLYP
jgi:hypothetical protein